MIIKGNSVGYPLPDPRKGLEMQDGINMNGQKITGLNTPVADDEAANKGYVDENKVDKSRVVNNFTTTEEGFVADAMALKVLNDSKTSIKPLWENASPSSQFAPQTISLDLSGYNLIVIEYKRGYNLERTLFCIHNAIGNGVATDPQTNTDSQLLLTSRLLTASTTGITFNAANRQYAGETKRTDNNGYLIPVRIYGIKGVSA